MTLACYPRWNPSELRNHCSLLRYNLSVQLFTRKKRYDSTFASSRRETLLDSRLRRERPERSRLMVSGLSASRSLTAHAAFLICSDLHILEAAIQMSGTKTHVLVEVLSLYTLDLSHVVIVEVRRLAQ